MSKKVKTITKGVQYVNYKGEPVQPKEDVQVRDYVTKKEFWERVFARERQHA